MGVLITAYTVDVIIALEDPAQLSMEWWADRYTRAAVRAGGMPAEIADPLKAILTPQTDPETGDEFVCARLPLPPKVTFGRATELSHMLTSVFAAEGYTLRRDGERIDTIAGENNGEPTGEFGGPGYSEARVCSHRCYNCIIADDSRLGCCGQGGAWSLADIGSALLAGEEQLVADWLALPGERDGVKWHPYLQAGRCVYHDPSVGCTLPPARMPLQCRTYLCMPEQLLPPDLQDHYTQYVDRLEEVEAFVEEHMRQQGGVDFDSPLDQLKAAADKAFAAWEARK